MGAHYTAGIIRNPKTLAIIKVPIVRLFGLAGFLSGLGSVGVGGMRAFEGLQIIKALVVWVCWGFGYVESLPFWISSAMYAACGN